MKKIIFRTSQTAWLTILITSFALNAVIFAYEWLTQATFFCCGLYSGLLHTWLGMITTLSGVAVPIVFFRRKIWKALAIPVVLILSFYMGYYFCFGGLFNTYYRFPSPDNRHQIVVEEISSFRSKSGSIYKQVNPFFIERVSPQIGLNSAPFQTGEYDIIWSEDQVVISLGAARHSGGGYTTTIDFEK